MSASILNFADIKAMKAAKITQLETVNSKQKTLNFASDINYLVDNCHIDSVHKATLLLAKAIDTLSLAGPIPCSVKDQHARATNLMHSVFSAREQLLEKTVRIISADNLPSPQWEQDGISI